MTLDEILAMAPEEKEKHRQNLIDYLAKADEKNRKALQILVYKDLTERQNKVMEKYKGKEKLAMYGYNVRKELVQVFSKWRDDLIHALPHMEKSGIWLSYSQMGNTINASMSFELKLFSQGELDQPMYRKEPTEMQFIHWLLGAKTETQFHYENQTTYVFDINNVAEHDDKYPQY